MNQVPDHLAIIAVGESKTMVAVKNIITNRYSIITKKHYFTIINQRKKVRTSNSMSAVNPL